MNKQIILPSIPFEPLVEKAKDAWECGNVDELSVCMSNHEFMNFIFDNFLSIIERDLLEKFMALAYIGVKDNLSCIPFDMLEHAFKMCDKQKLKELGQEFPKKASYKVFRGVSGYGKKRRLRAFSWTGSLDVAKWFATRYELYKPMVYATDILYDDIYFYSNERNEQEYVCDIGKEAKLTRVWP